MSYSNGPKVPHSSIMRKNTMTLQHSKELEVKEIINFETSRVYIINKTTKLHQHYKIQLVSEFRASDLFDIYRVT